MNISAMKTEPSKARSEQIRHLRIMCCPACRGALQEVAQEVECSACAARYPVVAGVPILLVHADMDGVSQDIKQWYERNWSGEVANTAAKKAHEDLSTLGQAYIAAGERPFIDEMAARSGDYFVDIGCGAQPRVQAGASHRFHVCLDLSLAGLVLAREILGERGVFVVGSLNRPPLVHGFAQTCLAAHCIYHISADRQAAAIINALSLARDDGSLYIFYSNPLSFEFVTTWPVRAFLRLFRTGKRFYFHPLSIPRMRKILSGQARAVAVVSLRCFSKMVTQPLFALPLIGRLSFRVCRLMDALPPALTTYVVYRASKTTSQLS